MYKDIKISKKKTPQKNKHVNHGHFVEVSVSSPFQLTFKKNNSPTERKDAKTTRTGL